MRNTILKIWGGPLSGRWAAALGLVGSVLLFQPGHLQAQTTVTTIGGGDVFPPYAGYIDGDTWSQSKFATPTGLALDPSGAMLFVADYNNNAIRLVSQAGDTTNSVTSTFAGSANGVSHPIAVAVDAATNLYVLNQGAGNNGSVLRFSGVGGTLVTNPPLASGLVNATAMTLDSGNNCYVTVNSNKVVRIAPDGVVSLVGAVATAGAALQGIAWFANNQIALSDAGNNGIWLMNITDGSTTALTGFHGAGDILGSHTVSALRSPQTLSAAGNNVLVVADYGNHKVKLVDAAGTVSLLYGVSSNLWVADYFPGWSDGPGTATQGSAQSRLPYGVVVSTDGSVFVSEDYYHILRHVTGAGLTPPSSTLFGGVAGIAYDSIGNYLFIANANNTIQRLDPSATTNATSTFLDASNGFSDPVSVLLDTDENVYVLNRGLSTNGFVLEFDKYGNDFSIYYGGPLITGLNQPTAFTMDAAGTILVAEQGGRIRAFTFDSSEPTIVATVTNANVSLQGIALFDDGTIAVSDAGNQVIWTVNPITKLVSRLTGQLGASGTAVGTNLFARFNQPHQLARAAGNQLVVADYGNNRLVLVQRTGTTSTNHFNSYSATVWFGNNYDPVATNTMGFVPMVAPFGVALGDGLVFASETRYDDIRGLVGTTLTESASQPLVPLPVYSDPSGIALNNEGTVLFVADPTNNTVSALNLVNNQTVVFLDATKNIYQPVDVAVDSSDNVYVLNQGAGGNGSIFEFDENGNFITNLATSLSMPVAMKRAFNGDVFVAELGGAVEQFYAGGSNTTLVTITNANVQLSGIAVLDNGSVVVSDAGNQVLWKVANMGGAFATNAVLFTGKIGIPGAVFGPAGTALLNRPMRLAQANGGLLLIADSGNNRVVVAEDSGKVDLALSSTNATLWFGLSIDPVTPSSPNFVNMFAPIGLAIKSGSGTNGIVYTSESVYKDIRAIVSPGIQSPVPPPAPPGNLLAKASLGQVTLTWTPANGATNYNVKRTTSGNPNSPFTLVGQTSGSPFVDADTNLLVMGGSTLYYVVTAVNAGGESLNSGEVSVTLPMPPVPSPQIGYVDFPATANPTYSSVFHQESSMVLNNDAPLVIVGETAGGQIFYTYAATSTNAVPDPTTNSASAPGDYVDGKTQGQVVPYAINPLLPDVTIKALGAKTDGSPNSAIVQARFQFVTGNPNITGDNAGQFTISDVTAGAHLYYTIDGSDPSTTNGTDLGTMPTPTNLWTVGFPITSNTLFKARAYRDHYQPSAIVSTSFSASLFVANIVSFGFGYGEASSDFVAAPGQTFYAPITLTKLPGTLLYSFQFNVTVTNAGPNPGPAVAPNAFGFETMLMKPDPNIPGLFHPIEPYAYQAPGASPPPDSSSIRYDGNWFQSLETQDTAINLLTVGWLERAGETNLYDTTSQDLTKYSLAHDDLFPNSKMANGVIVGGYSFVIPSSATNGQTYQIQIGRPSGTSDGIGAPGSDVFIAAPTNGSTAGGQPMNALKYVTVGQRKYIAGSVYPFSWFNAGDFGSSNIVSADVEQVFQSAVYFLNEPPPGSDLFDGMDSCGGTYVDLGRGYLEFNSGISGTNSTNPLFDGNDTSINQVAFGDGVLDVCDVYVTFRRSLDPSLTWFQRYWQNGQRVAQIVPNVSSHLAALKAPALVQTKTVTGPTTNAQVNFVAADATGSAGQTVQVPINATVFGQYPLRVLMLNLTVTPLDGSPDLATPVSFTQTASTLGVPYTTDSQGNDNYSAVWLNSTNAGLTGTATLGYLTITIPATATGTAAYAIHFDHASASPNGLASFPKQTLTGLITLSSRTNSYYRDGIPDSWRLRYFGTIYNVLSASNACPSGDGISNWQKFVAGVDPSVANDFPSTQVRTPAPAGSSMAIHWPSVSNKQYVIQRSPTLFNTAWTAIATNTGTGGDMEFDDASTGKALFYRVLILQ